MTGSSEVHRLGYLFWHAAAGDVDRAGYETGLVEWHRILAAHPAAGSVRSWTWRLPAPPWLVGWPAVVYLDTYVVADFAALGALNDHAPNGPRQGAHDLVAGLSAHGSGGVFACRSGMPWPDPGEASRPEVTLTWYDKPPGTSYPGILDALAGAGRSVWLRQMVLGSGPELLVVGPADGDGLPASRWVASAVLLATDGPETAPPSGPDRAA